ncbi:MAG: K-box domain-containing protein [Holosporaceae bacterium]|nr:K-box domain-containing protein [Holosporaceae bacterium]
MKSIFGSIVLSCLNLANAMEPVNWQKCEEESSCPICCVYEQIDLLRQKIGEIQEENRQLRAQLKARSSFIRMPDFSKPITKNNGVEYVAEEDGWLQLSACVGSAGDAARLYINGAEVLHISTGWSCISCAQIAPVQAGDRYVANGTLKGGSFGVNFFPCK